MSESDGKKKTGRPKGSGMRPLSERFWEKVRVASTDECWEWQASKYRNGYGRIGLGGRDMPAGLAHRVAWELVKGTIPKGMCVCHKCDNPACVNPAHLFLGTIADNVADAVTKHRVTGGSLPGVTNPNHKLTARDVLDIRRRYAHGGVYQYELAEEYGISQTHVSLICRGESWRNIPGRRTKRPCREVK